jgi:hypothetical protein
VTDAELRSLLLDCLKVWEIDGRLSLGDEGWEIGTMDGVFSIARADPELRPARWMLQTPERRAAGRPARAAPSIVAALSALRNNLGAAAGQKLRVGGD